MNRILFEKEEIVDGVVTFGGVRAEHVLNVLHGEVGQILKTGEVNGPIGTGEIVRIEDNGWRITDSANEGESQGQQSKGHYPLSSINYPLQSSGGPRITAKISHGERSLAPWVDMILAPPRPRVMKRLLPQMAAMGVGRIVLVGAEKVEKDFWGATLLKEENYRPLLIDGLMQCGTSILPTIETWKSFNRFLREGLPMFAHTRRIVAHPYGEKFGSLGGLESLDVSHQAPSTKHQAPLPPAMGMKDNVATHHSSLITHHSRALLAIGPEGGWTDAEVEKLEAAGFVRYSLGSRILRTDTATIALLAQLMPKE